MKITFKCSNYWTKSYQTKYNIGDIVKIVYPGSALSVETVKTLFSKENYNPPLLDDTFGMFPKESELIGNAWKVIDIKALFHGSIVILLVNRNKTYVVMEHRLIRPREISPIETIRKSPSKVVNELTFDELGHIIQTKVK